MLQQNHEAGEGTIRLGLGHAEAALDILQKMEGLEGAQEDRRQHIMSALEGVTQNEGASFTPDEAKAAAELIRSIGDNGTDVGHAETLHALDSVATQHGITKDTTVGDPANKGPEPAEDTFTG